MCKRKSKLQIQLKKLLIFNLHIKRLHLYYTPFVTLTAADPMRIPPSHGQRISLQLQIQIAHLFIFAVIRVVFALWTPFRVRNFNILLFNFILCSCHSVL